jgi:hypothetical protein
MYASHSSADTITSFLMNSWIVGEGAFTIEILLEVKLFFFVYLFKGYYTFTCPSVEQIAGSGAVFRTWNRVSEEPCKLKSR